MNKDDDVPRRHWPQDELAAPNTGIPSIAIIGMSGRFPGASNLQEFWTNLREGRESIARFSSEELLAEGETRARLDDPHFVPCKALLTDAEAFDAHFFGYRPQEAVTIDPQQRLFLECAHASLESAGYAPQTHQRVVGVFGGVSMNTYVHRLYSTGSGDETVDGYQVMLGNDKDHLATRIAYKLDLRGPSLTIQTACSTSLVAVERACQSLAALECDLALAGGASVSYPRKKGYVFQENMILSRDGHCRALDASANGTVVGEGVGVVVLKRLEEAIADRDPICAIIRGWAINNDGSAKMGYTAPALDGQAQVIMMAQELAEADPASISYVEAHATGTELGDAIELAALTQAFQRDRRLCGTCRLGSVKSNIGHLDVAAGIAGLIKTVLSLQHEALPPSLHFQGANPKVQLDASPFIVNRELTAWPASPSKRRAGVSSFGVGGANAHLILEEAPPVAEADQSEGPFLLPVSARTQAALEAVIQNLAEHLQRHGEQSIADIAFTLQRGRQPFSCRALAVCQYRAQALQGFGDRDTQFLMRTPDELQTLSDFSRQGELRVSLARTWLEGGRPDWNRLHVDAQRSRVALPTYPFERQTFDVLPAVKPLVKEEASVASADSDAGMVYRVDWKRAGLRSSPEDSNHDGVVLAFVDSDDLCTRITTELDQRGATVIRVTPNDSFKRHHELSYGIRPGNSADYVRLLRMIDQGRRSIDRIVHLWNLRHATEPLSVEETPQRRVLERGSQSLIYITQAIERLASMDSMELMVVSSEVEDLIGGESLCPSKASILGPCLVMPQEYPQVRCRHVDVDLSMLEDAEDALVAGLTSEFLDKANEPSIAFRGDYRWRKEYSHISLDTSAAEDSSRLRRGGVYLITGGLGNIGLTMADYLFRRLGARVVLTSRTAFPPEAEWDQLTLENDEQSLLSRRIARLKELTRLGAELLVVQADPASLASWQQAIAETHDRFGKLNGIIHAAGNRELNVIHEVTPSSYQSHFDSRVSGLPSLARTAEEDDVDFVLVNSSLSSALGGIGHVAYAASMAYLDAFVLSINARGGPRWIGVNWDTWDFGETGDKFADRRRGLKPSDCLAILDHVLSTERPEQVLVSAGDLSERLRSWINPERLLPSPSLASHSAHSRPPLETEYVAPRTSTEQQVSQVWQALLGISKVGIHDDYQDLGGDSLLAGQIVVQLRRKLDLPMQVRSMFDHQTVAQLSKHIDELRQELMSGEGGT